MRARTVQFEISRYTVKWEMWYVGQRFSRLHPLLSRGRLQQGLGECYRAEQMAFICFSTHRPSLWQPFKLPIAQLVNASHSLTAKRSGESKRTTTDEKTAKKIGARSFSSSSSVCEQRLLSWRTTHTNFWIKRLRYIDDSKYMQIPDYIELVQSGLAKLSTRQCV